MLFWQNEAKKINLFKVKLGKGATRLHRTPKIQSSGRRGGRRVAQLRQSRRR